jgi:hypothetical protein
MNRQLNGAGRRRNRLQTEKNAARKRAWPGSARSGAILPSFKPALKFQPTAEQAAKNFP